jgi:hypothetical protein
MAVPENAKKQNGHFALTTVITRIVVAVQTYWKVKVKFPQCLII